MCKGFQPSLSKAPNEKHLSEKDPTIRFWEEHDLHKSPGLCSVAFNNKIYINLSIKSTDV